MNRLLIALCLFGLVALAFARPGGDRGGPRGGRRGPGGDIGDKGGPGGQKGGKGGPGGRGGDKGGDLVCEVTSETFSMTRTCVEGECSLGPLISTDPEGNQVSTKFCDAVNTNGTSLVAERACLITDMEGKVLFNRTRPDCNKDDVVDRPVVECIVEMEILFENEAAKAFFPNGTKGGHRGHGGRRGDSSEESSEEDEDDVEVTDAEGDDESAPEAVVAGQQGGKGKKPSRGRPQGRKGGKRN